LRGITSALRAAASGLAPDKTTLWIKQEDGSPRKSRESPDNRNQDRRSCLTAHRNPLYSSLRDILR
jgi:hypothetical protein